jgi:hypothetical protein
VAVAGAAVMNYALAREVLDRISFENYRFVIGVYADKMELRLHYREADIDTGVEEWQVSRPWLIDLGCTPSDLVRTAFKAVMTSMEHRAREGFTYKGVRVFGPHFDVDKLVEFFGAAQ